MSIASGYFRSLLAVTLLATLVTAAAPAIAKPPRELNWQDLVPPAVDKLGREADALREKLRAMSEDERQAFRDVDFEMTVRGWLASGMMAEKDLSARARRAIAEKPSQAHPQVFAFWKEVNESRSRFQEEAKKVDKRINGEQIRIPGYVLPLEFDGTGVREFLLVPYVGACIHVPPPPPNQMVYVRLTKPFKVNGLYQAVWVEGTILTEGGSHELSLVDGSSDVDVGYTLNAVTVAPY